MSPDDSSRNVTAHADVEAALARALDAASAAGRFDVVAMLAGELQARRLADAGNIVRMNPERRRKP